MPKHSAGQHDPQQILQKLRGELKAAEERRNRAFHSYDEAMRRFHTDKAGGLGSNGLQQAFLQYSRTQEEVLDALIKVNDYLLNPK